MTSSVAGLRRSSKPLPKAKLALKKMVMVTVWWSATCLIHYSFLNPGKTITSEKYAQQNNEIHWKLQCLQPALVNRMDPILHEMPNCTSLNQHIKIWMNWATKFCFIHSIYLTSLQLTITSSISITFCRKNIPTTSRRQNALQELTDSWSTDFYAIGINKLISHWQKTYWL